jgi:hypothetical protein
VHDSRGSTLALCDGWDGRLLVRCWAGCETREVLAELRRRALIGDVAHDCRRRLFAVPTRRNERDDATHRIAMARRIWDAARDALGTPVARYLAGRGITTAVPPTLRWAPALRRPDGRYGPAMIARIDGIDGELIGIARTWLSRDAAGNWSRLDRAMLGRAAGGAVWLASTADALLIGEGVETTLAGIEATGLPGCAALRACQEINAQSGG